MMALGAGATVSKQTPAPRAGGGGALRTWQPGPTQNLSFLK